MRSARRFCARLDFYVLVALLVGGALFGLYELQTPKWGLAHMWPVHSHRVLLLFGAFIAWVLAVVVLVWVLVVLYERGWKDAER